MNSIRYLNPPIEESRQFGKNYLEKFIIEFRFPALLEIGQSNSSRVIEIQKALRAKFPHYDTITSTNLTPAGSVNEVIHEFQNNHKSLTIALGNSSISISTHNYTNFADAKNNSDFLLQQVVPHLETDFFTRVGVRYINKLPVENNAQNLQQWINEDLAVASDVLGTLSNSKSQYAGKIDENLNYLFQCGISGQQVIDNNSRIVEFVLDYDYYQQNVYVDEVLSLLDKIHNKHFSFFWWSIGEKPRKELEDA